MILTSGLSPLQSDTEMVSILYRMHKSLGPSSKIHSLYVFDALTRAARSKVVKQGLTGDINSEKGNCATFLLKIDGVLDGLIRDMISIGTPEAKVSSFPFLMLSWLSLCSPTYDYCPSMGFLLDNGQFVSMVTGKGIYSCC